MTIYHKDAKKSGYASPREVAAMQAEIDRLQTLLREILYGPTTHKIDSQTEAKIRDALAEGGARKVGAAKRLAG